MQDWYNTSSSSAIRSWTPDVPAPEPWKSYRSPLRDIPGAANPWRIRNDPAHTFAIQGFGSSLATSAIILLTMMQAVTGASMQEKLDKLFFLFLNWCRAHGKSSSLDGFTLAKFKMPTLLTSGTSYSSFILICFYNIYISYACSECLFDLLFWSSGCGRFQKGLEKASTPFFSAPGWLAFLMKTGAPKELMLDRIHAKFG